MTLYDRVWAAVRRKVDHAGPLELTAYEAALADCLGRAPVYDLTAVSPLLTDWERERSRPIPKRAPGPTVWAEWTADDARDADTGAVDTWRVGALVEEVTDRAWYAEVMATLRGGGEPAGEAAGADGAAPSADWDVVRGHVRSIQGGPGRRPSLGWVDAVTAADLLYVVHPFRMLLAGQSDEVRDTPRHTPLLGEPTGVFAFRPAGEAIGSAQIYSNRTDNNPFGFGTVYMFPRKRYDKHVTIWQPFMAFSLLHCKNVVTRTHAPDAAAQKGARKSGNPPRVTVRTIELAVPQTVAAGDRGPRREGDGPGVRFHLCRGHFKDLRHPRFKNPGLHWWPATWRGDPDKGEVVADYALTPGPAPG